MHNSKTLPLDSSTTVERLAALGAYQNVRIFSGILRSSLDSDGFGSAEESCRDIWFLVAPENALIAKTWEKWQQSTKNCSDALQCLRTGQKQNIAFAVFEAADRLFDKNDPEDTVPKDKETDFLSFVCSAASELADCGVTFSRWSPDLLAIVKYGETIGWKLLPIAPVVEKKPSENEASFKKEALARTIRLFDSLPHLMLLGTEPCGAIFREIAAQNLPVELLESLPYCDTWEPLAKSGETPQVRREQDASAVKLLWTPDTGQPLRFLVVDSSKAKEWQGRFIWESELQTLGDDVGRHPTFRLDVDQRAGSASWRKLPDDSRYETIHLLPIKPFKQWFQCGEIIALGGPDDATMFDAYFDAENGELVVALSWSADVKVRKIRIVVREDRFAASAEDVGQGIQRTEQRLSINHPARIPIDFDACIFVSIFSEVRVGNRVFFSLGTDPQSRKQICKER
ncbi:MAG: hypothetical protein Q4D38_06255 [Planctomycetia bacterium]|nr:hypothetical protein [Planctomycetia bacterium]